MQSNKLGDSFFTDVEHITKQNGGLKGYEEIKSKCGNEKNDLGNVLAQIDQKIVQTKKEDADFVGKLKQAGGGNTLAEYVCFEPSNPDLISNIIGVHSNMQHYAAMEAAAVPEYEKSKTWLVKLCDPNQNWNSYAENSTGDAFIKEHMPDIDMVIKVEQIISQIGAATHKEYAALLDVLDNFEIYLYVSKVAMREMTEESVYQELDDRTKAKFEVFDEHCRKCLTGLDKVSEKANVLAGIEKYANESDLTAILQAVKFYKEVYPKFTDLLVGYHKLNMEGTKARDQLDDYLIAKTIERQHLLEDVSRRKTELENEQAARKLQEQENAKQAQPRQTSHAQNFGNDNSNFFGAPQQPNWNTYGQQQPNHGQQPNYGNQQGNYPQIPHHGQPQTTIQYTSSWGRPTGPPIAFKPSNTGIGYSNQAFMNPHFPPWYNTNNGPFGR